LVYRKCNQKSGILNFKKTISGRIKINPERLEV